MKNDQLKKLWQTLAEEQLIDKELARENISAIISQKGNGVISKLTKKLELDYYVYLGVLILIPFVLLLLRYRDSQGLLPKADAGIGTPYLIPCLIGAFMIYALISLKRTMNFIQHTYNIGTLRESLLNVKFHFHDISKRGYWIGTLSLIAILVVIELDTLLKIGTIKNFNFSFQGPYIFESYFSVFLLILILAIPFIVAKDKDKYSGVLQDLEQTLAELDE